MAAVVVSVVHLARGDFAGRRLIDGREVEAITAFLFHRGGHEDPTRLHANARLSFLGSKPYGLGFIFDESGSNGLTTPISDMERLIDRDPSNADVVMPFIGGHEVNSSPTQDHGRYAINFGSRPEEECRRKWPEIMAIVEAKVKPVRLTDNRAGYRRYWWQYGEKRVDLWAAVATVNRVLVLSRVSQRLAFAFLPKGVIYSESLVVF
jgi:hypothetical protein